MGESTKQKELADFLKTRRMRLSPQEAGLDTGSTRRRTPGLRREEVAVLSGVSLAWYTYLEQGRQIRVSDQVLESLARTLKLDKDERNYLFLLAGQGVPADVEFNADNNENISPAVQLILDGLNQYPAYVIDRCLNIVAWNQLANDVFGSFEKLTDLERNIVWRMFTREDYRTLFVDWEYMAKGLLAQFRGFYGRYTEDPWYQELVEKLMKVSNEFRQWWEQHEVNSIPDGKKEINHPKLGLLKMDYTSLLLAENPNMVLTVFTPQPNSNTKEKLNYLKQDR
ncbi:helix-turn-helix transcriptional regulator [Bacillus sp. 03113]|uniref:helix-turn-helix transcriptional regulator n=1 Tax=Bacillus sp. 03113 TaxID=2578211 RepID=UPI0011413200|nr:helix-turn-helix transcriptional regulator [Bacillus sp. 03113]